MNILFIIFLSRIIYPFVPEDQFKCCFNLAMKLRTKDHDMHSFQLKSLQNVVN